MPRNNSKYTTKRCSTRHGIYEASSRFPKSWCDYDLKINPYVRSRYEEYFGRSDIMEMNNEPKYKFPISIPNEVLEKIVRYFDGRTMLKFKMLSKRCSGIVYNSVTYNRLWKHICSKEVPAKDLSVLYEKNYKNNVDIDSLSEHQYEKLYRQWIGWQATNFNIKFMCQKNFMSSNEIIKILCHKSKILVVFPNCTCVFSILITDKIKQYYREIDNESLTTENEYAAYPKSILIISNQQHHYVHININEENPNDRICPGFDDCPFNMINRGYNGDNCRPPIPHELITIIPDYTINICCWIKENCAPLRNKHYCNEDVHDIKEYTLYSSVLHGIIIDKMSDNCVQVHKFVNQVNVVIRPWLEDKYIEPTAIYIFLNILFVGTWNGYLLAYRLKTWDDIFNIKKKNLLLETQLNIGKIISLDVMNTDYIKAIIAASISGIVWIKFN